jgi:hypothetical protein
MALWLFSQTDFIYILYELDFDLHTPSFPILFIIGILVEVKVT